MAALYERISALCKENGIKGGRLCTEVGISKSVITDLKSGRKKSLNAATAQKIASYFGVTVGYLLGEEEKTPTAYDGYSESKKALIEFIKTVPDDKAEMILRVVKSILDNEN